MPARNQQTISADEVEEWRTVMAGSVNKVILIGNLGADPEIKRTQDGRPIANLRIATSETWRDKNSGERKEKTEWHRVVIFSEGLCKIAEQYLKKGAKVYIEGQLQTRKWTDQSGVEKYSTEVVLQNFNSTLTMLDGRGEGRGGGSFGPDDSGGDFGSSGPSSAPPRRAVAAASSGRSNDMDDDIPF
jgi:single-strand DNA-binding protein